MTLRKNLITLDKSRLGKHYIRLWNGIATSHSRIVQEYNTLTSLQLLIILTFELSYFSNSLIRF